MSDVRYAIRRLQASDLLILSTCWISEKARQQFMEASLDWCNSTDPGEIFVFTDSVTRQLIGVTGWYPIGGGKAFLRWHGVIEEYRGKGMSVAMLAWLAKRLKVTYQIDKLYETCNEDATVTYFEKLGFVKVTDKVLIDAIAVEAGEFKHTLCMNTARCRQPLDPMFLE